LIDWENFSLIVSAVFIYHHVQLILHISEKLFALKALWINVRFENELMKIRMGSFRFINSTKSNSKCTFLSNNKEIYGTSICWYDIHGSISNFFSLSN
jgi:hypothetical protein